MFFNDFCYHYAIQSDSPLCGELGELFLPKRVSPKITENTKGSSANYFPWLTIAIYFLPFALILVAVVDVAYRLMYNKSSGVNKGYGAVLGVLFLSLVIGWIAINNQRPGKENPILPVVFAVWIGYNLLMFVNLYMAMKTFKKQKLKESQNFDKLI